MSVKLRSPIVSLNRRRRSSEKSSKEMEGDCWESSTCSGDRLINEHASRLTWWLAAIFAIAALILVGVIMQHAYADSISGTGPWNVLQANPHIQPTPRALASLVGITIVLDLYTSYMMALKKGHLDSYMGQFVLSSFLRAGLWIFFLYGLSYGGTIGSLFALSTLALVVGWGFMTSHSHAPLHSWLAMLELVFIVFLIVWLSVSGAKVLPS